MAARLQFEANFLGEIALILDDQNRGLRQRFRRSNLVTLASSKGEMLIASVLKPIHGAFARQPWRLNGRATGLGAMLNAVASIVRAS